MARLKLSLEQRAVLMVAVIHVLALPIVTGVLLLVAQETLTSSFVQRVRTLARGVADGIELPSVLESAQQTGNLLDSVILTGEGVYAELLDDGRSTVSVLNRPTVAYAGHQDLEFSESSNATYFIVLPLDEAGHIAEVRLGFDKRPTLDTIARIRWNIVKVLVSYAALSLGLTVAFVRHLTRPLAMLRRSARQVAGGDYERRLSADTSIPEVQDLAADLETMRGELVGVNAKLRTAMTERQRVESQRQALEIELRRRQRLETIGRLTGGVAHEINNSLVPILVFAQIVFDALPAESPSREHVLGILRSARRSKEVIKKMLTFSRQLDSGKLELLDLSEPVSEVVRLFGELAPPDVAVVKRFEAHCAPVLADATLINLLMMNLCTNAVHAMGQRGVLTVVLDRVGVAEPRLLSHGTLSTGSYVRLSVTDTGSGIPPAVLERMFDPFFTTKRAGDGTGLGLSLVHGIVADFGGAIDVATQAGAGTTFAIWLPAAGGTPSSVAETAAELPRGNGETVMIVDDEPALVALAEETLAELGYEPVGFDSSVVALQAFRAEPKRFDLVLTDEAMPELMGTELAREIRQLRPDISIILVSGYSGTQLSERAQAAGIIHVLRKPLVRRDIAESVARALHAGN